MAEFNFDDFRKRMLEDLSKAVGGGEEGGMEGMSELRELLGRLATNFETFMAAQKKYVAAAINANKASSKSDKTGNKDLGDIDKSTSKAQKALDSMNKNIKKIVKDGVKFNKKSVDDMLKAVSAAGAGGGGSGIPLLPTPGGGGGGAPKAPKINWKSTFAGMSDVVMLGFMSGIKRAAGEMNLLGVMFGGVLRQEGEFKMEMRDVAFVTQGITGDMRGMQAEFKAIESIVEETGKSRTDFQRHYMKLVLRGVRDQKLSLKQMKIGLHTSVMVGDITGEIGDKMAEWGVKLNLSSGFMGQLNIEIREAALKTGVMGVELSNVVKGSQKIIETMKNVGTLSAEAAGHIITMRAEAKKLGVEQFVDQIQTASASWMDLMEADPKMRAMLFRAANNVGKINELREGTAFLERENIKQMAKGIEMDIQRYGKIKSIADLEKMSSKERMLATARYRSATGKDLGEALRGVESLNNSAKSYEQRLEEINKQKRNVNLTEEKRHKLELEGSKITFSTASKYLATLEKGLNQGKSLNETLASAEFSKDMKEDIAAMGGEAGAMGGVQAALKAQAKSLKEMGSGKNFAKAIKKNMSGKEMMTLQEEMMDEQRKLAMEASKGTDPAKKIAFNILKIRDSVSELVESNDWITDLLAPLKLIGAILGEIAALFFTGRWLLKAGLFTGIADAFKSSGLLQAVKGKVAGTGAAIAGAGGGIKGAAVAAGGGIKSAIGALPKLLPKLMAGFKGLLGVVGKLALPITVVLGAIGGIIGGFKAMGKAADIFQVEQDKLTIGHKVAAASAGTLTGILNFLTFGIFKKALGPTGAVTTVLAKLFKAIDIILVPFMVLWGVIKGLWLFLKNAFIGLWEGIKIAIEPLVEVGQMLWDTLKDAFKPIMDLVAPIFTLGEGMKDVGGVADVIAGIFGFLGDALGWVFKILGKVIAIILKFFVPVIKFVIMIIGKLIKIISAILAPAIQLVMDLFGGLVKIFEGIITLDFGMIAGGIWDLIKGIFTAIYEIVIGIPMALLGIIGEAIGATWELMKETFWGFPGWLWDNLVGALSGIGGFVMDLLTGAFIDLPMMVFDGIVDGIANIGTWIWDTLTGVFQKIWDWLVSLIPGAATVKAATGTLAEDEVRRAAGEGGVLTGAGSAMGGAFGAAKGLLTGDFGGAWEDTKKGIAGVGEALAGLWPFQEGTTSVKRGGPAVVDAGEAVVPTDIAEGGEAFNIMKFLKKMLGMGGDAIAGVAEGPFGGGILGSIGNVLTAPMRGIGNMLGKTMDSIFGFGGEKTDDAVTTANAQSKAFTPDQVLAELSNNVKAIRDQMVGPGIETAAASEPLSWWEEALNKIDAVNPVSRAVRGLGDWFGFGGDEAKPAQGGDMEDRIQARVTGSKAGLGQNPALEGIEMASYQQVDMLAIIHEDLQTLIGAMGSVAGDSMAPSLSTRTEEVPTGTTDYGTWQFGKASSQAGSQVRVSNT